MAFPEDVLTADENLVLHTRPHAIVALRPALIAMAAVAVVTGVWIVLPANDGGRWAGLFVTTLAAGLVLTKAVWPFVEWRCTHWVFTTERVLIQEGVLRRERADLPLNKIADHGLRQSILDRILGTGTLTIDTANESGPERLARMPHVVDAQTTLYGLIEGAPPDDEDEPLDEVEPEPPRRALPWKRR